MATAERAAAARARAPDTPVPPASLPRRWAWPALALVLLVGLGLRLWGIEQGLPYAYNADEADHFVPRAVAMFGHSLNPHYFANPPAFTYVLHYLFAIAYGGGHGARVALALHPAEVYTLARVAAAVLGVAALWLLYATGARLFGRAVGLLAAAIEAVAFLPSFYSHLALNDVPTLAPLTLSLLGTAGIVRRGRARDYALAGVGLGLACATKYTGGIALVPLVAAVAVRLVGDERARTAALGVALAAALALVAFLVANPYSLLDYSSFHSGLVKQSAQSAQAQGKLGAPRDGGFVYYLWTLTWGLGWAPAIAALGGAIAIWRRRPALGWVLVPAPLAFLVFMGLQGRYFGRWLLPIFPLLCLLAAFFVVELGGALTTRLVAGRGETGPGRGPGRDAARGGVGRTGPGPGPGREAGRGGVGRPGPGPGRDAGREGAGRGRGGRPSAIAAAGLGGLLVAVVLAQGTLFSVHSGLVLARADTRNIVRRWLVAHVPSGSKIVAEPVSPDVWARERAGSLPSESNPYRWHKYPSLLARIAPDGSLLQSGLHVVGIEDYERTLAPALLGYYESHGYCTVISGSTESGRAFADRAAVPQAVAYYHALQRDGEVLFRASPYARGAGPVAFGFDWSFDYYPLAYARPGPSMTVFRLHGGRCGR